jgi:hypothetical protein
MEGMILALVVMLALATRFAVPGNVDRARLIVDGLIPAALVTVVGLAAMAAHNRAVTGDPLSMPYQAYQQQYGSTPILVLAAAEDPLPQFRHDVMRAYALEWGRGRHARLREPLGFVSESVKKLFALAFFFLGPTLLLLLVLRPAKPRHWTAFAMVGTMAVLSLSFLTKATFPHYVAPTTGLIYALLGTALMAVHRRSRQRRRVNMALVCALVLAISVPFQVAWVAVDAEGSWGAERAALERGFRREPGRDLVFVEYGAGHSYNQEWVYNEADIDASEVVWARSMGDERNRALRDFYPDRVSWRLVVDQDIQLDRYEPSED